VHSKNIVIPLETEYLDEAAKARGISRTYLVRILMEKVILDRLVSNIIGDERIILQRKQNYRRFPLRTTLRG
jgi:hypothetical protein